MRAHSYPTGKSPHDPLHLSWGGLKASHWTLRASGGISGNAVSSPLRRSSSVPGITTFLRFSSTRKNPDGNRTSPNDTAPIIAQLVRIVVVMAFRVPLWLVRSYRLGCGAALQNAGD